MSVNYSLEAHRLRVPVAYLLEQWEKICIREDNNKLSLILSAESSNMFVDERGNGKVGFSKYLISNSIS